MGYYAYGDSQKGTYNAGFVPAALASCTLVYYIIIYSSHVNQLKYSSNCTQNVNKEIPFRNPSRNHTDTSQCSRFSSRFLQRFRFLRNNHLPRLRFLPAQTEMVICHSWPNSNKIIAICSGIIICSHLFTCFCTRSTGFRSDCCVRSTSALRSFRSLSSFKMAACIGR